MIKLNHKARTVAVITDNYKLQLKGQGPQNLPTYVCSYLTCVKISCILIETSTRITIN